MKILGKITQPQKFWPSKYLGYTVATYNSYLTHAINIVRPVNVQSSNNNIIDGLL